MSTLLTDHELEAAAARIAPFVVRTPLLHCAGLSELFAVETYLKCELFQHTGSFKLRGATNKILSLTDAERARGVLAFSAGNHAMAVASAGRRLGIPITICMPAHAVRFKVDAVRSMGVTLELVEGDLVARAKELEEERGLTLVHPFDDPAVIAGQASVAREILADLPGVATIVVPVGGGGLLAGTAVGVKRAGTPGSNTRVIGVEPDSSDVVQRSLAAGKPVPLPGPKSLADGLTAPITGQAILDHVNAYVDEMVTIAEGSIAGAWQTMMTVAKLAAEPAAAVGIAAVTEGLIGRADLDRGPLCLIVTGGNADFAVATTR